jgi:hypothetical protein
MKFLNGSETLWHSMPQRSVTEYMAGNKSSSSIAGWRRLWTPHHRRLGRGAAFWVRKKGVDKVGGVEQNPEILGNGAKNPDF